MGNLDSVRARVAAACAAAGRQPEEVTLVVVTKYFPASDVRLLHRAGVRHVAENRHQEAVAKREMCSDLDLSWHFVGQLQSNKAAAVGAWADVVQSVDRERLVTGLGRAAQRRSRPLEVLLQVSLDPPAEVGAGSGTSRGGVSLDQVGALAAAIAATEHLVLRGVMGVAPPGGDPAEAFARLATVLDSVRAEQPSARWLSAGMSGDLEAAIGCGATHVRVGTAILGNRPTPG